MMDLESVKRNLEKGNYMNYENDNNIGSTIEGMPIGAFELFTVKGLVVDLIEPGHLICSMKVPPRLLNSGYSSLHGGAMSVLIGSVANAAIHTVVDEKTSISLEFNISFLDAAYLDEEIEIEARVARAGTAIGVISVDVRKKKTGKIIALARYTDYLVTASKM
ncbi:uncharacterized protein [Euphorbia lathyris]|uniref:uncharacterized protein isoform X1 n=1 Tax=Euphorbia lathyris TaxID=212925 RepID=UPI003313374F